MEIKIRKKKKQNSSSHLIHHFTAGNISKGKELAVMKRCLHSVPKGRQRQTTKGPSSDEWGEKIQNIYYSATNTMQPRRLWQQE